MRLTQIRDLLAIMDAGSIRSAARALGITSPVLTRSVRELEKELSVQLLERTAHGVIATQAGKTFLARARVIQNELGRIHEEAGGSAGGGGLLVFGVGTAALPVLPGALVAFRQRHPATEVRIQGGTMPNMLPQLRAGQLEFALGHVPPSLLDKHTKTQLLFRHDPTKGLIVARRGHPLRKAKSLVELADAQWLSVSAPYGEPADSPLQAFIGMFERNGVAPPRSRVRCHDSGAYLTLLAETDMITTMPALRLRQRPWCDVLEAFDIRLRPGGSGQNVRIVFRADSPLTPAAAAMLAAVKAEARKLAFGENR